MNGDMTVHEPDSGIVGLEGYDHKAVCGKKDNISTRGILPLQIQVLFRESLIFGLLENGEIMSV